LRRSFIAIGLLIMFLLSGCSIFHGAEPASNNNPSIESVTCTNDVMALADNEMACLAIDPDGDSLKYEWSTNNGEIIGTGAKMIWVSPGTMGIYDVEVKVSDGKGGEAKRKVSVRVLTNADGTTATPVSLKMNLGTSEVISENRTVKVGTATKINCIINNATGRKLSYEWSTSGGTIKGTGIDAKTWTEVVWTAPALTQEYIVTIVARDEQGNDAHGRVIFDVFCCPRN